MPLTVSKNSLSDVFNRASLLAAEKFDADLFLSAPGFPAYGKSYIAVDPYNNLIVTKDTNGKDLSEFTFSDDRDTFGYLSYNYGKLINGLSLKCKTDFPLGHLKKYSAVIEYDPGTKDINFSSLRAESLWAELTKLRMGQNKSYVIGQLSDAKTSLSKEDYIGKVRRTIHYIREGYIYQLNLSIKYDVYNINYEPVTIFAALWRKFPAPFYCYFKSGKYRLISTSPERFLSVRDGRILSQPIKGTLTFSRYKPEMVKILTQSTKESAELSMIVDMVRNDISKSCGVGSVKVSNHKSVFQVDRLLQMYSDVRGVMSENRTVLDLLLGAFPGASITGCPKLKAMELIDALEPHERDAYCGSFFKIRDRNNMESSIAIRSGIISRERGCITIIAARICISCF